MPQTFKSALLGASDGGIYGKSCGAGSSKCANFKVCPIPLDGIELKSVAAIPVSALARVFRS